MARPEVTGKRADESSPAIPGPHRARPPPKKKLALEPLAFSVEQFCRVHDLSIGFFYTLLKAGLGPKIMKLGTRTLISAEEAARWRDERTAASSNDAA